MNASTPGTPGPLGPDVPASDGPTTAPAGAGRSRRRRRRLALGALAAPVVLAGCNWYPSYGASRGATAQGSDTFKLYSGMMTAGIVIGGIVAALILWSVFRYRRRSDEIPHQFHENLAIEAVYTLLPIVIVLTIFAFTVITENKVMATQPANATVTSTGTPVVDITVTAFQWGWRFDYPNLNVDVTGELTNGPDNHGPQMVVPAGQTVQITLVSADVIHGFYVRDFNFSRYAQPGVVNVFDLNVLRQGTYDGQCTQFCGLYHSQMLFSVRAVTPNAFRAWAASEVAAGHTIPRLSPVGAQGTAPGDTRVTPSNALPSTSTATAKAAA